MLERDRRLRSFVDAAGAPNGWQTYRSSVVDRPVLGLAAYWARRKEPSAVDDERVLMAGATQRSLRDADRTRGAEVTYPQVVDYLGRESVWLARGPRDW